MASNLHLFVESAFMVYNTVQFAHIVGPILGGCINAQFGMSKTCVIMGWVGASAILVYILFAVFVYCTVHHENNLSLNLPDEVNVDNVDQPRTGRLDTISMMFDTENSAKDPETARLMTRQSNEDRHAQSFTMRSNMRVGGLRSTQARLSRPGGIRFDENSKRAGSGSNHSGSAHNDSFIVDMKKDQ